MSGGDVLAVRRRRAVLIVAALAAGLLVALAAAPVFQTGVLREAANTGAGEDNGGLPEGFEEEVLQLDGREDVRVDEGNGLVGFSCRGEVGETLRSIEEDLLMCGWESVGSGSEGWRSFVKDEGRYRWMFVECVDVGDSVSVVVRFETTGKGA